VAAIVVGLEVTVSILFKAAFCDCLRGGAGSGGCCLIIGRDCGLKNLYKKFFIYHIFTTNKKEN